MRLVVLLALSGLENPKEHMSFHFGFSAFSIEHVIPCDCNNHDLALSCKILLFLNAQSRGTIYLAFLYFKYLLKIMLLVHN